MSNKVLNRVDDVSAEWLTQVLTANGALIDGVVSEVVIELGDSNWATNGRLTLKYSPNARGTLPTNLFLKVVTTNIDDTESFTDSEVVYYTRDYVRLPNAPLLTCYDAAYSAESNRYHLLLEDVSATHKVSVKNKLSLEYGLALAEALAALHAHWWGAQRLATAHAPIHKAQEIEKFVAIAEPGVKHILGAFSAELKPHWPKLIHDVYKHHPQQIIERTAGGNNLTLIHGDLNAFNIMVPRVGQTPLYFIDRQPFDWSLTTWMGVYDLVYIFMSDWSIALRRQHEQAILRHYHQHLIKNGVTDYSWQKLYDDYRLCVPMGVYFATEYCRDGINQRLQQHWMDILQRTLTAMDDLQCHLLWETT